MILSRRSILSLSLSALAAPALIRPAHAAQCGDLDLTRGVAFSRKDGSKGIARREGDGSVYIDYVTNRGEWLDKRRVKNGVFEITRVVQESEELMVGSSAPDYTWTYSPKPKKPEDGMVWTGKVKELVEVTISDEHSTVQRTRTSWTASYRCFEPREVKLSGCTHRALTVEATFKGERGSYSQRWVYLPDLGLGLETKRDGTGNGITALQSV
jgi:hypothetical protein